MDFITAQNYFGESGLLSGKMPGFEYRPQQTEMSRLVDRALKEGRHLIVEAGTGTGKSLAYLIPAILWAVANNKKVVISTYTKALQEQILHHDLPSLKDHLNLPFRYAICMGHENYLSLRRLKRARQAGLFTDALEEKQLQVILDWAERTPSGLRSDLPFEPLHAVWEDVGRQKDLCMGKNCETYGSCFYFKERKRWFGAHLLIVNHHLFFANVASNGAVLPAFDAVVFDEAQNLEEAATSFLGLEVSNTSLYYFLDRLHHPRTKKGVLSRISYERLAEVQTAVTVVRQRVDRFFEQVFEEFGRTSRVLRFHTRPLLDNTVYVPLKELHDLLKEIEASARSEEDRLEAQAAANRCFEFNNALSALLNQNLEGYVYWLEIVEKKRYVRALLRGVPIHVAPELKEQVFNQIDRVILTSATLTTHQGFKFIEERIGFQPHDERTLDSPFDYPSQALIYLPRDLPEPSEKIDVYAAALAKRCHELILAAGGKTFVLFTSYAVMHRVYEHLEFLGKDYRLLRQGDVSPREMIRRFKETPSVIFGTNSFWQGIDIPGDALKSVIITKLPFDVPSDPITEARLEHLRVNSIDPFSQYQIPRAIIQLKQGFGRLIRKKTDTGVVSILDTRMATRGYGRHFLAALPECAVVEDLEEVKRFFNRHASPGMAEGLIPS
ncbi:MAG: ATP-dependent DNA helicase [Nitrospinaceae bacterium]|nr:MAG: ATP-dependent DNA helicase [Nitrospinaceae bacterium]